MIESSTGWEKRGCKKEVSVAKEIYRRNFFAEN
jgi:hypothetical protein